MQNNYKFRKQFLFIFLLFSFAALFSGWMQYKQDKIKFRETKEEKLAGEEEQAGPADTVKFGAYIISVYDLNFPQNKVNVDFYVWYNSAKDSLHLIDNFELVNGAEYTKTNETDEKRGNIIYQTFRIKSTIKKNWDISNFPFDKQTIEIQIEDYDKDVSKLVFIPDTTASKFDPNIHVGGWQITGFGIKSADHVYETNYGDPDIPLNEYSSYSRVTVYVNIEREGNGIFFKLFIGLFISVLMSFMTLFIDPSDLDPRFGLSVGAIFAAIASQYVITSTLPQSAVITLVDILHDISFIFIFICIVISVISLHFKKSNNIPAHKKLDKYSFFGLSLCYIVLVLYFVIKSI